MPTVCADISGIQTQLTTLVNEVLSGECPAEALPAGCLLLASVSGTQLRTFAPGDVVEASFGMKTLPTDGALIDRNVVAMWFVVHASEAVYAHMIAGDVLGRVAVQWDTADTVRHQTRSASWYSFYLWVVCVAVGRQRGSIASRCVRQSVLEADGKTWLHHDQVEYLSFGDACSYIVTYGTERALVLIIAHCQLGSYSSHRPLIHRRLHLAHSQSASGRRRSQAAS